MKTVVIFQGGGALGAFGCGAWSVLGPLLRRHGGLAALGGASIGAVNAAVVARGWSQAGPEGHEREGAAVQPLQQLWQEGIATPSVPFVLPALWAWTGRPPEEAQRWNGVLTSLLFGNPVLQRLKVLHRLQPGEPLRLVTVDQIVMPDELPDAGPAMADAAFAMLQGGKLSADEIDWDGPVQWVQVRRRAHEQEGISGQFDASPERIAALVADGMQAARQAWAGPQALGQSLPAAEHALP